MAGVEPTSRLLDLLGENVSSPEVAKVLAEYPGLKPELDDSAADEGIEPVRYLRSERDGLLIKLSAEGEVLTIFMMSEGKDGFSQFRGELPGNLAFSSRPADALKLFGAPGHSRPAGRVGSFRHGELLRFDWPGYSIHFQYRGDHGGIELVTAMVAQLVPGRPA
jgi:hypothetical protein